MSDDLWGPWVHDYIDCNPLSGSIIWKYRPRGLFQSDHEWRRWNDRYAHTPAFACRNANGYLHGVIRGQSLLAHRVVWAMVFEEMPVGEIDHINGIKDDNRISNLRRADRITNCRNSARRKDNTSGHPGVTRSGNSWLARIGSGNFRETLGSFDTVEAAISARKAAEKRLGYSERHGS